MPHSLLTEHTLTSRSGNYTRKVWLLEPEHGKPERVALFLDGEYYAEGMKIGGLIHDWTKQGKIPATACLFVSHGDGAAARHEDLACNDDFATFIAEEVAAWMRLRFPDGPRRDWMIAGPSLGGLEAAFIALSHPQIFSRCLSQSGSFWWEGEWLARHLEAEPPGTSRLWVSVGDCETVAGVTHPPSGLRQDVSQVDACERFVNAALARGNEVHFHVFAGGHSFAPWLAELPEALTWLLA